MTGTSERKVIRLTLRAAADSPAQSMPLEISGGLPPFVDARSFILSEEKDAPPFLRIQCKTMDLFYILVDPFVVLPEYAPVFSDADLTELQIDETVEPHVLSIVNFSRGAENVTLNLAGPLLINPKSWRAKQVVLENAIKYSTCHKLLPA